VLILVNRQHNLSHDLADVVEDTPIPDVKVVITIPGDTRFPVRVTGEEGDVTLKCSHLRLT